ISMFMGQIVEAGEQIELALKAFNESSEDDRLAARAAGQDAGVADLALMSWTLWLLGRPDTAAKRIEAALHRAESIAHPHTRAYACYYAAVLYALRGELQVAQKHAEQCLDLSETHGFRQWHGLARAVKGICQSQGAASAAAVDDVKAAVDEYRSGGYQLGITALYVLLCPVLLQRGQSEEALEIIERGLAIVRDNSERIFAAELMRLRAGAVTNADERLVLLESAAATAKEQQARALELRAVSDLAQLRASHGEREKARDLLKPLLLWFDEGQDTRDLKTAAGLLASL